MAKAKEERKPTLAPVVAAAADVIEAMGDGLIVTDLDGNVISINKAMERKIADAGVDPKKLIGKSSLDIPSIRPEEIEKYLELMKEAIEKGKAGPFETQSVLGRWNSFTVSLLKDAEGNPSAVFAVVRDITDLKRAEEERAKAAADREKAAVIDAMPDSLVVLNLDGELISANSAHLKMFGHKSADEILGLGFEGFKERFLDPEKDIPKFLGLFKEVIEKGATKEPVEIKMRKVGGEELFISASANLLKDAEGNPKNVVAILRDITELKERETERKRMDELEKTYKELRETQSWLIQVAKMAAVGQLAAGIAHEINNPLGIAYGFLEILRKEVKKPSAKKDLGNIKKALDRCKEIVRNLLDFSRLPVRGMEITNVNKTIKDTLSLVSRQLKNRKIELVERLAPDLPEVVAVPTQLQQVYMNLIFNAQDAMPRGGKLIIRTERSEDGKFVEIIFKDTGKGIPKENIRKIFDPFFTTKPGVGMGLGLSISYGIIKAHKGEIEVQSRPEKAVPAGKEGSTFTIKLLVAKTKRRRTRKFVHRRKGG